MSYSLNQLSSTISVRPLSSLVVWYKFDNSDITYDSSGNGYHMINRGAIFDPMNNPINSQGSIKINNVNGQYFEFNQSIDFYNIYSINGITFAMWMKFEPIGGSWLIFNIEDGTGNKILCYRFNQYITLNINSNDIILDSSFIDNNWHHLVWCISSSGRWIVYKDGINLNLNVTRPISNAIYNVRTFGLPYNGVTDGYAKGNISDLRIYKKVINENEVTNIYNNTLNDYTIGIGTSANANTIQMYISGGIFPLKTSFVGASSQDGTFIALGAKNLGYSKCAIGHVRQNINDQGSIVFLNRASSDEVSCDLSNEIMRITNSNVGIFNKSPSAAYKLDVTGSINATGYYVNGSLFSGGSGGSGGWTINNDTYCTANSVSIISPSLIQSYTETNGILNGSKLKVYGDVAIYNGDIMNKANIWTDNCTFYGTVGINTNNPNTFYQLDVNGIINASNYTNCIWQRNNDIVYTTKNVAIGTDTTTSYALNINGNVNIDGKLSATGNITAFTSDMRLKNITGMLDNSIILMKSLSTFKYKLNDVARMYGLGDDNIHIGISAQELHKIIPELTVIAPFDRIHQSGNNYLTIKYDKLIPFLIEAVKMLRNKYIHIKDRILELEKYINKLNISIQ